MTTWGECATEGCYHLDVAHEENGPCTIPGCHCGKFHEQVAG